MSKILSNSVIQEFLFEKKEHIVSGSSMQPLLCHGQKVLLSPCKDKLNIGHIYVFLFNGKLLMHRLITLKQNMAVFMGDYSFRVEKIHRKAIVAKLEYNHCFSLLALIRFINIVCYSIGRCKKFFWVAQKIRITCIALILGK